jgi:hypothetical protein
MPGPTYILLMQDGIICVNPIRQLWLQDTRDGLLADLELFPNILPKGFQGLN